jgi:hypothetical protein
MTIGYHINAAARTVEQVNYTSVDDIHEILGCDMFASAGFVGGDNLLLVDDAGLWKPATHFWRLVGSFEPVPHDALLVGPDKTKTLEWLNRVEHHERPSDPTISVAAMRSLVEWVSRAEYKAWIDAHRDQAAVEVNGKCIQTWGQLYAEMPKP